MPFRMVLDGKKIDESTVWHDQADLGFYKAVSQCA